MTTHYEIANRHETQAVEHLHRHAQTRNAVIPTAVRLDADTHFTGRGITIALLDSGFYPHPDLVACRNHILAFHDVTGEEESLDPARAPEGWQWHGTQTAAVAAGNGFLSDGTYCGLAREANLVLVKVGQRGRITEENIERGLRWVIENRERYQIRVVNLSLGGDEDVECNRSIIDRAAEEAVSAGIVVVAAAGNAGCSDNHTPIPPANSPSVITVGGYDDRNQIEDRRFNLYCSNYGETIDRIIKPELIAPAAWVAAPILPRTPLYRTAEILTRIAEAPDYQLRAMVREAGADALLSPSLQAAEPPEIRAAVEALLKENKIVAMHYQHVDGTSFAAPIVSSVIAQMLEANPQLTPASVRNILCSTADRLSHAPAIRQGYGVLNARMAVYMAKNETHVRLKDEDFSPPRIEDGQLVFFYHNDEVGKVAVAGEFNSWNTESAPFIREESGIWRARLDIPAPGLYRYKLVVNEVRWIEDPSNSFKEPDDFGGFNSILNLA